MVACSTPYGSGEVRDVTKKEKIVLNFVSVATANNGCVPNILGTSHVLFHSNNPLNLHQFYKQGNQGS